MRGTRLTYAAATVILCHILTSCIQGFTGPGLLKDPRLYNPKKKAATTVAPEPDLGFTGGADAFDLTDKWYNKRDSNGDDSKPDAAGFDASEFDSIQITGWFSSENVPTYTMTAADVWAAGDESRREYVHAGAPDTEGQGWPISGVTYYQYRGLNPGYAADGNYNKALQTTGKGSPKLSRFFFYRFTGKGGGIQWLDNNLIAVDTYSKLVFAFSEPVEFSSMGAPTKWSPTDASPYIGQMYQFYMYDPVGYVAKKDDGSYEVVLYQWFQDNLAKGNYKAKIDTAYTKIAEKKPDGAGKSPFNNHTADFFVENMKLLAGTPFYRREVTTEGANGLVLYKYLVSQDGKTITRTAESWNGLATDTDLTQKTYTVGEGTTATKGSVTGEYSGELELADESRTLKFSNDEVAVSNFTDLGPDWLERVKHGPTYEKGSVSYQFSEGGKKLVYINGSKTYNYEFTKQYSSDERNFAVYWTDDAFASGIGIGYAGFGLYNDDYQIKTTNTSAGGEDIVDWLVMTGEADLKVQVTDSFASNLKGKTFSLRKKDSDGLYGLSLTTYSFSGNNTKQEVDWYTGKETSQQTVAVQDTNKLTGTIDGQQATLTMPEDGNWTLTINGETYYRNYSDPGPSFVNRVKNRWYTGNQCEYVFSNDGKTLYYYEYGSFEGEYTYSSPSPSENVDNTRADYGWTHKFFLEDTEKGRGYNLDYENWNTNYDATYKGTAEEAKAEGFPPHHP